MRSPWKVIERIEYTVIVMTALYLIGHIVLWISRGFKVL